MISVIDPLDPLVVTTLATTIQTFQSQTDGSTAGQDFERVVFQRLLAARGSAQGWRYATGPDQFDMGLQLVSRTGVRYEFDGVFGAEKTLYVLEAKHFTHGSLTREHIGVFLQKLLDTLLGSYRDLAHFTIKPIVVCAQPNVDAAAYQHAVAWGILLISPARPTPLELLAAAESGQLPARVAHRLAQDCPLLASRLWRPFNQILTAADDGQSAHFTLRAEHIFDANQVTDILDLWNQCLIGSKPM